MKILLKAQTLALATSLLMMGAANANQLPSNSGKLIAQAQVGAVQKVQLSTDQLERLSTLKDKLTLDTAEEKAQLKVDRHQLFNLLSKPTVDKQEVLSLESKMNALKNQLSDARVNFLLSASDVLTPEQRAQMHTRMLSRSLKGGFHNKYGHKCQGKGFGKCSIGKPTSVG